MEMRAIEKLGGIGVVRLSPQEFASRRDTADLTLNERNALKKLRRRYLGRTYAAKSRVKQITTIEKLERDCKALMSQNKELRQTIVRLSKLVKTLN